MGQMQRTNFPVHHVHVTQKASPPRNSKGGQAVAENGWIDLADLLVAVLQFKVGTENDFPNAGPLAWYFHVYIQ